MVVWGRGVGGGFFRCVAVWDFCLLRFSALIGGDVAVPATTAWCGDSGVVTLTVSRSSLCLGGVSLRCHFCLRVGWQP